MKALPLVLALAGCGTGLSEYNPHTGDTGLPSPIDVWGLDPAWGPTSGGTVVTLTGEGFEGATTVAFDGTPVDAFRNDATTLLVTTPAWAAEGTVDVTVTSDLGSVTLPDAFTYSNSGPPPTDVGGTDVSGLVEFTMMQVACPSCLGIAQEVTVSARAALHTPTAGSWIGWMPAVGSCVLNPQAVPLSSTYEDAGGWLYLTSGATSLPLRSTPGDSGVLYEGSGLLESDYLRNASWALDIPGVVEVPGALRTTEGFTDIQPLELLYVNPQAAFSAVLRRSGAGLAWAPAGSGDRFVVTVDAYHPTTGAHLGSSLCVTQDSGSMVYPASHLPWPNGSLLTVGLLRYRHTTTARPDGQGTLEGVSWIGVTGTAVLAN